jgi:Bacterial Ig-like domain (group 1)/SdrD B-like domain
MWPFNNRSSGTRSRSRRSRKQPSLTLELLEKRELLAATAFLQGTAFTAFLQGTAFIDGNSSNQLGASDARLTGATVKLFQGSNAAALQTTTTDVNGNYLFTSLAPGNYRVIETPTAEYRNSGTQILSQLDPATQGTTPNTILVTVVDPNHVYVNYNGFGNFEVASSLVNNSASVVNSVGQMKSSLGTVPAAADLNAAYITFCADFLHSLSFSGGEKFQVLPGPTTGITNGLSPISTANAGQVAYLFNHYASTPLTNIQAGALQLAIWELIYDPGGTADFTSGNFQSRYAAAYSAFTSAADFTIMVNQAKAYFNEAKASAPELAAFLDNTLGTGSAPLRGDQGLLATESLNFANVPKGVPMVAGSASASSVTVGAVIHDQADVSGGYNPTGTVTFNLYSNPTGAGPALFTDTKNLVNGTANSAGYTVTAAGADYWVVTYNGDGNNAAVSSAAAAEPVSISPADQTIAFTAPTSPITFVPGETVALSATSSSGGAVAFGVDSGSTGSGSIDGAVLTITSVGSFIIDANQAGDGNYNAAPQVRQTLVVNPGPASQIVANTDLSKFTAGQSSHVVTVKVEDAYGNGIANQYVHLGSSSGAGRFIGTDDNGDVKTDSSGFATFQYTDTVGDAVGASTTLTLHDVTSSVPDAQLAETVYPAQATAYIVTGNLQTFNAGQSSGAITVKVVDGFGNVVPDQNLALGSSANVGGNQSGQFLSSGSAMDLNGEVNTGDNGTASFVYTDTLAGSPVLTLTDNTVNIGYEQLTENVSAGAADHIVVSTDSQKFTAGQDSNVITVKVKDVYGNDVADQYVHLSSSSAAGQFIGTDLNGDVKTDSSGFATFQYTDTVADAVGASTTLTLHDVTSSVPDVQLAETVDPGQASQIVVSTGTQEFIAGQTSSVITVTVEDAYGNIVRNQDIALGSSSPAGAFLPDGWASFVGAVNNQDVTLGSPKFVPSFLSDKLPSTISDVNTGDSGTTSFLYTDTLAGLATLSFTDAPALGISGLAANLEGPLVHEAVVKTPVFQAQLQETVDPARAYRFNITGDLQTLTPGQKSGVITAQVVDLYGNVLQNQDLALSSSGSSGQFLNSDTEANLNGVVNTGASGTASFLYTGTVAGGDTLEIVDKSSANGLFTLLTETVVPGQASQITFMSNPPLTAGVISGPITVRLADADGNPVTDGEFLNLKTSAGTGQFFSSSDGATIIAGVKTDGNGRATFFYKDSAAGTPKLTATDSALPDATGQLAVSVKPAKLLFVKQPSNVAAGQADTADAQVKDQAGNLVTTGAVTFAVVGDPAGAVSASIGPDGTAHFSTMLDAARIYNLTASFGPAGITSAPFTVSAAAPAQLTFVSQPGKATAGQSFRTDVKVVDQFGNAAAGIPVTVAVGAGPSFTFDDPPIALVAITDGNGVAHFTNLILDAAGAYRLTASAGALAVNSSAAGFVVFPAVVGLTPSGVQVISGIPLLPIGTSFGLTGAFIDQGMLGLNAMINWGDGQIETLLGIGQGAFSDSHSYTAEGSYVVTVQVTDGSGLVVGVGAVAEAVQVFPADFGDMVIVVGQSGQTVTQTFTDKTTGATTTATLTLAPGEAVGDLLAAHILNYVPTPTPAARQFIAAFDIRQINLSDGASALVTFVIPGTYSPGLAVYYVDAKTGQQIPFSTVRITPGAPGTFVVSIFLDGHTTPTLEQAVGTVFTVAASTPSTTTTTGVSAAVASAASGAPVAVQTASFQSTSQLTLTLAASQASQVSTTRSALSNTTDGGGGDAVSDDDANALLQFLFEKLDFLPKYFFHQGAVDTGGASANPIAPAPTASADGPQASAALMGAQELHAALDFIFRDPAPLVARFGPAAKGNDLEGSGPQPHRERPKADAPKSGIAAYAVASLAGAGLYISGRERRRKVRG